MTTERPEYVKNEHLEYLDELRESGVTSMWGAGEHLGREFECENLAKAEASGILSYWMKTFGDPLR